MSAVSARKHQPVVAHEVECWSTTGKAKKDRELRWRVVIFTTATVENLEALGREISERLSKLRETGA